MNGEFQVWQRSTSEASLGGSNGYFTTDRWRISGTGSQRYTMSRSTDTPTGQGFSYSMKIDCTTTHDFSSAGDYMFFHYRFEGQDLQMIEKGTANAKPLAVSFWVKSPKTGVHIIELTDEDNTRYNSQKYTVSSANTWEKHVVVFPGDTTGAFVNDTSKCCYFAFWGGAGTTYNGGSYTSSWHTNNNQRAGGGTANIFDSTSNDFYMTGFQIEVGDTATAFEHRSYADELALCKRYYEIMGNGASQYMGNGWFYSNSAFYCVIRWEVQKRAVPSIDQVTGSSYYVVYHTQQADVFDGFSGTSWINVRGGAFYNSSQVSGTSGNCGGLGCNNASAFFAVEAEL